MNPSLIFALLACATFVAGGIAGGRSVFAEKLRDAYLKDANAPFLDPAISHDCLVRSRKAETTASRWDSFGILAVMFTVLFAVLACVNLLTELAK